MNSTHDKGSCFSVNDSHAGLLAGVDNPAFDSTCFDHQEPGSGDQELDFDTSYENNTTDGDIRDEGDLHSEHNFSRNLLLKSFGDEV